MKIWKGKKDYVGVVLIQKIISFHGVLFGGLAGAISRVCGSNILMGLMHITLVISEYICFHNVHISY